MCYHYCNDTSFLSQWQCYFLLIIAVGHINIHKHGHYHDCRFRDIATSYNLVSEKRRLIGDDPTYPKESQRIPVLSEIFQSSIIITITLSMCHSHVSDSTQTLALAKIACKKCGKLYGTLLAV